MTPALAYSARCYSCEWTAEGGVEVDRLAERHVRDTKHGVVTSVRLVK